MKNTIQLFLITACLFYSCNKKTDNDQQSSDSTDVAEVEIKVGDMECFAYQVKKDSAFLQFTVADEVVDGLLDYKWFEKDHNSGKITGKMNGDTLIANYTFMSEGVESVREVAFLKKGSDWVEGSGPVEEKQGVVSFKDRSKLSFAKGMVFKAVDCM